MCLSSTAVLCLLATFSAPSLPDSQNSSCSAVFTATSLVAPTPEAKLIEACLDASIGLDFLLSPQLPSPGGQFMPCPVGPTSGGIGLEACLKRDREGADPRDDCA